MQGADFADNLFALIELARRDRVVLMCAEAVPWRCHRSLIAGALLVRGVASCEIVSDKRLQAHRLTPFADVRGVAITYPASGIPLTLLHDPKECRHDQRREGFGRTCQTTPTGAPALGQ